MTYYWIVPPRRHRRSCGSISVLQTMTLFTASAFVITLVVLGNPLLLVAGIAIVLLSIVLGRPLPRLPWRLGGEDPRE
jgi:hypothetical protein